MSKVSRRWLLGMGAGVALGAGLSGCVPAAGETRVGRRLPGWSSTSGPMPGGWSGAADLAYVQRCVERDRSSDALRLGESLRGLDPARTLLFAVHGDPAVERYQEPLWLRDGRLSAAPPGQDRVDRSPPLPERTRVLVWSVDLADLRGTVKIGSGSLTRGRWQAPPPGQVLTSRVDPSVDTLGRGLRIGEPAELARTFPGWAIPDPADHLLLDVRVSGGPVDHRWDVERRQLDITSRERSDDHRQTLVVIPRHRLPAGATATFGEESLVLA